MKKIIEAVADGCRTERFFEGATCGGGHISYYLDIVSDTTREHERRENPKATPRKIAVRAPNHWRNVVASRIASNERGTGSGVY